MKNLNLVLFALLSCGLGFSSFAPAALAQSGGYYEDDYPRRNHDRDYRDDYDDRLDEQREERRELEYERRRLEAERRELQQERARVTAAPTAEPAVERCPSGFQPSENKCSVEERRRGCKDMRLPGGLGCVRR